MRRAFLFLLFVGLVSVPSPAESDKSSQLNLPRELAAYRDWPQLLKVPYQVPLEQYIRCVLPRPQDWNEARKKYGPHTQKFIRVYGNQLASDAFKSKRELPVGSIIAKEKFSGIPQGKSDGVAFMVKHALGQFPESGGWEFLYFPAPLPHPGAQNECAACHQAAKSTDFVFGKYPRNE